MDTRDIYFIVRTKLGDGRLPRNGIPRMWGSAGNGEQCDACQELITKDQFVMEGISVAEVLPPGRRVVQFHPECFYIWDHLRRL